MSVIDIFLEENRKFLERCKNILNMGNIDNQIQEFEKLLNDDNVDPNILLSYLELKDKVHDTKLPKLLETYEVCFFHKKFNEKFGKIRTKISFLQKLKDLFNELINIINEKDEDKKLVAIINIVSKKYEKYEQTFPLIYSINKEL